MEFINLKNLSNQAMVAATKPWVEPGECRSAMEGIPEVSGCLGKMTDAHTGLLRLQVLPSSAPSEGGTAEQALALDNRYDRLARGIDLVTAGNALLLSSENPEADKLTGLRALLFPNGMSITLATYLEEAGEVDLLKERLRPEDRALLAAVPTVSGNLETAVDEWITTGGELGALERKRARKTADTESAQSVSRSDVVSARNQWIRVVRAVLAGLDLADNVDDNVRTLILQPLALAVEKAAARNKSKNPAPETPVTEPTELQDLTTQA